MSCSIGCAKCLIIVFNIVYAIIGIALVSLGVIFLSEDVPYEGDTLEIITDLDEARSVLLLGSVLFIVSGVVIILFSAFGCCGAIKESTCLLKTFAVILGIFCIVQIAISAFAYTASNNRESLDNYKRNMGDAFNSYDNDTNVRHAFDYFQKQYSCCGVDNFRDYDLLESRLPGSCCDFNKDPCYKFDTGHVLSTGCAEKQIQKVSFFLKTIGAISTVVAIFEAIGTVLAYYLANTIRNELRRGACT